MITTIPVSDRRSDIHVLIYYSSVLVLKKEFGVFFQGS